jgi:hypothetical protein
LGSQGLGFSRTWGSRPSIAGQPMSDEHLLPSAMVTHDTRHIDQERVARGVRDGLERADKGIGKSSHDDWRTQAKNAR